MLSAAYCNHISRVRFTIDYYTKIIGYCYHSDNVIKNFRSLNDLSYFHCNRYSYEKDTHLSNNNDLSLKKVRKEEAIL